MDRPMNAFAFRMMSAALWFRYRGPHPAQALAEAGIVPGDTVLDFGCGPGGFSIAAASLAGKKGKVYALDIQPLAARAVTKKAQERGLGNIETITSGRDTGLPDTSVDVVLLYDIFHFFEEPDAVLAEIHRVLTEGGTLSASDHHLKGDRLIDGITASRLFRFDRKGKRTYTFTKTAIRGHTSVLAS
jgi:ubiquinone/menaquinone biosynthesis C-methylase UbiE